jgi:SAM-dependent methyltransferase
MEGIGKLFLGSVAGMPLVVSEEAHKASRRLAEGVAAALGLPEAGTSLASYWSLGVRKAQWEALVSLLPSGQAKGLRYAEIGCGFGLFVAVGCKLGFDCIGVEASADAYGGSVDIARDFFQSNGLSANCILSGEGEALDFPDASLDVICAYQTIEHVQNPEAMLKEIYRVLVPGGLAVLTCPNYLYPYEAHYGLALPLPLGRWLTGIVLRWRHRPIGFLKTLNWVTPSKMQNWLKHAGFNRVTITPDMPVGGKKPSFDVEPATLPYRFARGAGESARAERIMSRRGVRTWAIWQKAFPQIHCVAWKPSAAQT